MRERKFKEAFAMSIYKPAVEVSAQRNKRLRPDFEKMAAAIPGRWTLVVKLCGDPAAVFVKVKETQTRPRSLNRSR